jgi:hypothetical protein
VPIGCTLEKYSLSTATKSELGGIKVTDVITSTAVIGE